MAINIPPSNGVSNPTTAACNFSERVEGRGKWFLQTKGNRKQIAIRKRRLRKDSGSACGIPNFAPINPLHQSRKNRIGAPLKGRLLELIQDNFKKFQFDI
jgi:hypothetical protein